MVLVLLPVSCIVTELAFIGILEDTIALHMENVGNSHQQLELKQVPCTPIYVSGISCLDSM